MTDAHTINMIIQEGEGLTVGLKEHFTPRIAEDIVEITNPGGLPPGLPRKSFGGMSVRRNELIADLFFRLHKVERVGMGIQKMRETMKTAGLKEPEFETDGYFRTTFCRPERLYPVASPDPGPMGKPPTQSQPESQPESLEKRILRLLQEGTLSKAEISGCFGQKVVSGHLNKVIRSLLAAGLIEYTIPDRPNSRMQKYRMTADGRRALQTKLGPV